MPLIHEHESYIPQNRQSRLQRSRGSPHYNHEVRSSHLFHLDRRHEEAVELHVTTYTTSDAIGVSEARSFGDGKDGNENDYLTVASPILDNKSIGYLSDEMGHKLLTSND
ncbi:567_t:CDS:2 [Paraglomus occultum]|uniref:567_t:CDS:1 n=1 Tax=Paraglomus occultum TaxID=144539 RepID=A0A9N8WHT9_9GLOM|nr:567_t:CDS:2 [Paraglomus occultum]